MTYVEPHLFLMVLLFFFCFSNVTPFLPSAEQGERLGFGSSLGFNVAAALMTVTGSVMVPVAVGVGSDIAVAFATIAADFIGFWVV